MYFFSFHVRYSTLLHLPPIRFHWDQTQDTCDYGIGCQGSNQSAISHPLTRLDLIHTRPDLIHNTRLDLIHCFVEMDESTFRCGPPKKGKDGRYHLRGKLTVISGMQLDSLLEYLQFVIFSLFSVSLFLFVFRFCNFYLLSSFVIFICFQFL